MRVLVLTHAVVSGGRSMFGPSHNVVERLAERGADVRLVEQSMDAGEPNAITVHEGGRLVGSRRFRYLVGAPPVRYVFELLRNVRELARGGFEVAVVVDPLNYAAVLVTRVLGLRGRFRVGYYTADYAHERFPSALMNTVYHALDRLALRDADAVWGVSEPIAKLRAGQGVPPGKIHTVPNAPRFDSSAVLGRDDREPGSVIVMAHFEEAFDDDLIADAIERLRARVPGLRVKLVGPGSGAARIADRVGDAVEVLGYRPHEEALRIAGRCLVGWAPYGKGASWHEYRDSIKLREYAALGLPAVTTPGHGLANEAVAAVTEGPEASADALERLLTDESEWRRAHEAAVAFAQRNDRAVLVDSALSSLGV
jgi:glycosyltransferase involved in cell wall biosynthesis